MPATLKQMEYDNQNTMQVKLKLNKIYDTDIIEALEKISRQDGGKQGYIKRLIREDIERQKAVKTGE